jgi:hypothetical protein
VVAVVVAADRWVLRPHFVVEVVVVVLVHASCLWFQHLFGAQRKQSRLVQAAQAAQHRPQATHRATQAGQAPTQRLVHSCVRVAGVAVALATCLLVSVGTQATGQTV